MMMRSVFLLFFFPLASAFMMAPLTRLPGTIRYDAIVDGADCLSEDSCSVEELETLLAEVKSKATQIKELESKLTALTKDDASKLKSMLAAEE